MPVSLEEWIQQQPAPSGGGGSAAIVPAETQRGTSPRCRVPRHQPCVLCAPELTPEALDELEEALEPVPAPAAKPAAPNAPKAAPAPAAPAVDPTTPSGMILTAAAALAQAIDRCTRLSTKIAGLECSLEAARKEQLEADAAKDVAQEALRNLVQF